MHYHQTNLYTININNSCEQKFKTYNKIKMYLVEKKHVPASSNALFTSLGNELTILSFLKLPQHLHTKIHHNLFKVSQISK